MTAPVIIRLKPAPSVAPTMYVHTYVSRHLTLASSPSRNSELANQPPSTSDSILSLLLVAVTSSLSAGTATRSPGLQLWGNMGSLDTYSQFSGPVSPATRHLSSNTPHTCRTCPMIFINSFNPAGFLVSQDPGTLSEPTEPQQ